jgi:hypothetical protein
VPDFGLWGRSVGGLVDGGSVDGGGVDGVARWVSGG